MCYYTLLTFFKHTDVNGMYELMNNSKTHCEFLPLDSIVPQPRKMTFSFAGAGRFSQAMLLLLMLLQVIIVIINDFFLPAITKILHCLVFKHQDTSHTFQNVSYYIVICVWLWACLVSCSLVQS